MLLLLCAEWRGIAVVYCVSNIVVGRQREGSVTQCDALQPPDRDPDASVTSRRVIEFLLLPLIHGRQQPGLAVPCLIRGYSLLFSLSDNIVKASNTRQRTVAKAPSNAMETNIRFLAPAVILSVASGISLQRSPGRSLRLQALLLLKC